MPTNNNTGFHLIIGNMNFSSWSMRGGVLMRLVEQPFKESVIRLDRHETKQQILEHSPAGLVPILHHDAQTIWDSLAIAEYLAELYPGKDIWPVDPTARAMARCVSAEMHSGFAALRGEFPMDIMARHALSPSDAARADIDRVQEIWRFCRQTFGADGAFLFGSFSAADAMFAPVVSRFETYGVATDTVVRSYMDSVMAHPAVTDWWQGAAKEVEVWGPTL